MGRINRRIGFFGGTFDPPHFGHLWLAETAQEQLGLDEVVFLPVGSPPHKQENGVTAVSHRLAMLKMALRDTPFILNTVDVDRRPPHTTISLIPLLQEMYPNTSFWLLIGADSLRDLPSWSEPQGIIAQCRLAVLPRPEVEIDWGNLETAVPGLKAAVDWLGGPTITLSSTCIRQWAAARTFPALFGRNGRGGIHTAPPTLRKKRSRSIIPTSSKKPSG